MNIELPAGATLHPLVLPARADAADAASLRAFAALRNVVTQESTGRNEDDLTAAELLPLLRSDADTRKRQWYVQQNDQMIGCVTLNTPQEAGARSAYGMIALLKRTWGQGIGSALHPFLENATREQGRNILQVWVEQSPSEGPYLDAPTGFGQVPRDHVARYLLKHDYRLEQVSRVSAFDLTPSAQSEVTTLLQDAQSHASDYRVVQWMLPTPDAYVEGYAHMKSRMSTDVPAAGLDIPEETWDAARLARHDQRYLDMGHAVQVTAAQHIRTGELCAFNELSIGADRTAATHQEDTLVLAGHRGHRLGMLVKCAALLSWPAVAPASPQVITYNAEENRPMLSINEAIGFTPIGYEGAWKKELK